MSDSSIKTQFYDHIVNLQDRLCEAIEKCDGTGKFNEDKWTRLGGGGGKSRVIENGSVFEKGGINISKVHGELPESMMKNFGVTDKDFFACGLSLVIHPFNPMVPTVHANFRLFELYGSDGRVTKRWFGGGADLTPYYLFEEDAIHFHESYKTALDSHDPKWYPDFKAHCDKYFVNHHRNNEMRGIGGIFYDYIDGTESNYEMHLNCSNAFEGSYVPIVEKRKVLPFNDDQKFWQEIRRGRYVEFNLLHDRGTLFGIKTNGRTESILMSLPPTVRWNYDFTPEPNTEEERLQNHLKPIDWINRKSHA